MGSNKFRQLANILALSAVIAFNAISQALPLNGQTSAMIANRYPDMLYFPANYAFSIWGIIYTFLTVFIVYQALPSQRENPVFKRIGYLFVVSSAFNIAWLTCFHFNAFPLSMVMMILLLGTLLTIYIRLGIGAEPVSRAVKWCVHIPFSLYIGWITAATITNAGYVLVDAGWNGFGVDAQTWAIIMLVVTGVVALGMVYFRRDIAYGAVIVWAVTAIASRHADVTAVQTVALGVSAITVAAVAIVAIRWMNEYRLGWSM
ncbi:MAG: tryptophan-rich sensory protein [Chloroflexi bacterium]|nr:tryptophan-rich sensory protein [Chloroflexota bacterium]